MKNIFLAIILFFIIPNSMQGNFNDTESEATIVITNNLLTCKSELSHKSDKWVVKHIKVLKKGKNVFDFISRESQRIEIVVTNY